MHSNASVHTLVKGIDRVIAVDWSGAREPAGGLAIADVRGDGEVSLVSPTSREEAVAYVIGAAREERVAVGLDFAFSYPAWFVAREKAADADAFWRRVAARGERWLANAAAPFSTSQLARAAGGDRRSAYRRTEREVSAGTRITPKSVFQIGGSGQVGKSSLRGMPFLPILHAAGLAVWPFHTISRDERSVVVEIYPRTAYGDAVTKSSGAHRLQWLAAHAPFVPAELRRAAAEDDHRFDALAAALGMWAARASLAALPPARDDVDRLEGRIWTPAAGA